MTFDREYNRKLVFILIFMLSILAVYLIYCHPRTTSMNEVFVQDIRVVDEAIIIRGTLISSSMSFRGYSYDVLDKSIFITIKSSPVSPWNKDGDFLITIVLDELSEYDDVYLKDDENAELIFRLRGG